MRRALLFWLLLVSSHVFAQDADFFKPDSVKRKIAAVKITTSLHSDGVMSEPNSYGLIAKVSYLKRF